MLPRRIDQPVVAVNSGFDSLVLRISLKSRIQLHTIISSLTQLVVSNLWSWKNILIKSVNDTPSRQLQKKPSFFNFIPIFRVRKDYISSKVESLSIGLGDSDNQEEARSKLRQFCSAFTSSKDTLSRYDAEKLNEVWIRQDLKYRKWKRWKA